MVELDFENFINEKIGIRDDVVILSEFLYNFLKDKDKEKIVIENNFPPTTFKISKIIIQFINYQHLGTLDEKRTKLTNDGIEIYLIFNKTNDLSKSIIYHELSHLIEKEIKLSKRIDDFKNVIAASKISNFLNNKNFDNLCNMIYLSDDSEIKSITHEVYASFEGGFNILKENGWNKNDIFNFLIKDSNIKNVYDSMINYNIFEDLRDVSDKNKIKFFNDLINWDRKIIRVRKKEIPAFLFIRYQIYQIYHKNNKISLNDIMYKTQKHINMKGMRLRNNIHRLYGLLENKN
mgnify:CR=1 FL=1